ncbi:hypothetical protein [Actinomadura algeriensis]|uniref:Uncharacterized protein n=1 Tax=Actinomadura algeriensis TaxID=1679523 RepID=A0ABR9JIY8_9ACTN|nr:hypothetical protein [Actinomadura algeriensis]MBE1530488.1 hypothetical protein [Actinomadura algeriensis]
MARRRPGRGLLRKLARHFYEGLVIVGRNTWFVCETPREDTADARSRDGSGNALTPAEREEFERLVRQALS